MKLEELSHALSYARVENNDRALNVLVLKAVHVRVMAYKHDPTANRYKTCFINVSDTRNLLLHLNTHYIA